MPAGQCVSCGALVTEGKLCKNCEAEDLGTYVGAVDTDERSDTLAVESSNIAFIGHTDGTLLVGFNNGSVYEYYEVPRAVYDTLRAAESPGRMLDATVKRVGYEYKKIASRG